MQEEERTYTPEPTPEEKEWKVPGKVKRLLKKADKKTEHIVIQYLTQKYTVDFKMVKIVQGNLVIVDNKVHELNPQMIWKYKKHSIYIIREIDRIPVSNEDIDAIKARKDDTESDVPLIKAAIGALQAKQTMGSKNMWWIILILAAVVGAVIFFGGK